MRTRSNNYLRLILILTIARLLWFALFAISQGRLPGMDVVALLLFSLFLWRMGDRYPLLNFAPFALMLATYESLRAITSQIGTANLHVADLISWEKALCGGIVPSHELQSMFGSQPYTWVIDLVTNGFYMTHFIVAVILAGVLWRYRRWYFWPFLLGMTVLSYAAFLTYVFFPAAPPWWAANAGALGSQPVNLAHSLLTPAYILATANPVASMPSLHTAYPFFIALFCVFVWGRKGLVTFILPFGVAISSIYLGHHYIIDCLAGMGYATLVFAGVSWWYRRRPMIEEFLPSGRLLEKGSRGVARSA
jgi:membrane-associated phospholipid phosphatase